MDATDKINDMIAQLSDKSGVSDGSHTFGELYEHRYALFLCMVQYHLNAWKSKLHDDGTMYDDSFIAGVELPTGRVSYHLPMRLWDKCKTTILENAPAYDGSSPQDSVERMYTYLA